MIFGHLTNNIKFYASQGVCLNCYHICQKPLNFIYAFKCYQNNITSKNVSWLHFSWATLYVDFLTCTANCYCCRVVDVSASTVL